MSLKESLQKGFVRVEFTKVDGTTRVLEACTTKMDLIPEGNQPKGTGTAPDDVQRVYVKDLGWRSFRTDSLISFSEVE